MTLKLVGDGRRPPNRSPNHSPARCRASMRIMRAAPPASCGRSRTRPNEGSATKPLVIASGCDDRFGCDQQSAGGSAELGNALRLDTPLRQRHCL